jgi:hypothetical protein
VEGREILQFLCGEPLGNEVTEKQKKRVRRRCRAYRFADGVLLRKLATGEEKIVPAPAQREPLVAETHGQTGHWGEMRTVHLLQKTNWWTGLHEAVQKGVAACIQCDRVKANFTAKMTGMQSLSIMGLEYWRSLDFAGPLITTRRKNWYVLIAIERFSKWCEVWPMRTKQAPKVAEAFLGVMTRFVACAEVLTNNGTEFQGEFEPLCQKLFLDHRWTSRYHPKSNGLTERLMRAIKTGITKYGMKNDRRTWDEWLLYLVMGYCMSNQAALGQYSSYYLMHGRQPLMTGAAAKQLLGEPINFDVAEQWVRACKQRAHVLRRNMPLALGNLLAAQHRD